MLSYTSITTTLLHTYSTISSWEEPLTYSRLHPQLSLRITDTLLTQFLSSHFISSHTSLQLHKKHTQNIKSSSLTLNTLTTQKQKQKKKQPQEVAQKYKAQRDQEQGIKISCLLA